MPATPAPVQPEALRLADAFDRSAGWLRHGVIEGAHSTHPLVGIAEYEAAAAELRRLHALLSDVEGSGWRPIETAPKDGTSILGYWMGGQHDCAIHATKFFRGRWWAPNEDYPHSEPTHWQPLPAPPAAKGAV